MRCHLYCASFFWAEANCSAIADADVICLLEWDFVASSSSHFCPSPSAFYCVIGIQGLWTRSFLELDFVPLSERVNYSCPCTGTFLFLCISLRKTSAVSSWRIGYNPLEPIRNLLAPCGFRSLTGACTVTTCLWKCSSVALMCSPSVLALHFFMARAEPGSPPGPWPVLVGQRGRLVAWDVLDNGPR